MKIKVSPRQFEKMRLMYAVGLAINYRGLTAKTVFEKGVNPDWLRLKDVLGRMTPKNTITLNEHQKQNLKEKKQCEYGLFTIKKTKKGYVVYAGMKLRIRVKKRVKKKRK